MIAFPPGLVLIVGGLLLAFLRGTPFKLATLILPVISMWAVWATPETPVTLEYLDYSLTIVQRNPPTMVFGTIFSLMAFGGAVFAWNQDRPLEMPAAFAYAGSAIGVVFAGDLFTMFAFWELMAIGSTLVIWAKDTEEAHGAGRRYVNVHLVGGAVMMAGITGHVLSTGSIAIANLSDLSSLWSWLILAGILVNAAAPPFGGWLPDAYPAASESGTVFLSAYTTKTSVYVLMVLFAGADILIYIGCLMAVYGIVYAILENDMRRILAYSIVNQVGFMVCGVGIGTQMALNGAAAHAFAHIIYKALLLMSAGAVLHQTGKRKCTELGGLYRTMPWTMAFGTVGALAISAFPFTSGFTTKSMITGAAAHEHLQFAWVVLEAASAGVFLHAGIKFPWFVFFQKDSGLRPPEAPSNMLIAMGLFAALCIGIGLYPDPLYAILPYPDAGQHGHGAAHGATKLYEAYTAKHLIYQFQLLLFSGLAFFLLLKMLKRTETITLDFDWSYRRMFPVLWLVIFRPMLHFIKPVHTFVTERLPALVVDVFDVNSPRLSARIFQGKWGVGPTVALITVFLAIFLVINLYM